MSWWSNRTNAQKAWIIFGLGVIIIIPTCILLTPVFRRMITNSKIETLLTQYQGKLTTGLNNTFGVNPQSTVGAITYNNILNDGSDKPSNDLTPTANDGINNPLNLRAYSGNSWQGKQTKPGAKFEQFSAMWYGYRAGILNLLNVSKRTSTRSFNDTIPILAPASDSNDIPAYIQAASQGNIDTTVDISTLSPTDFKTLIKNMAIHEQGSNFNINQADIDLAYQSIS